MEIDIAGCVDGGVSSLIFIGRRYVNGAGIGCQIVGGWRAGAVKIDIGKGLRLL